MPQEQDFKLYIQSQDLKQVHPIRVYLDTNTIAELALAPNDIADYYNIFCCFKRGHAQSIKVVVNDTIVVERSLMTNSPFSKLFIKVNSPEKRWDYNNPAIYLHMAAAGGVMSEYNLQIVADSLYQNGLIPAKFVQLPKDSVVEISFMK
ncbi:hypothetical protein GCM10011383_42350 [Hymenobacter cavernae]|uniref:DUF3822 family protein n=1 Tax=Hymenobacter cavernae TaxID=2044852 RepID=A0ABQ1UVU4_9BACT|nr:hypothetical protein GCM10011383_42350 [Hymenobacter cavernae]